MRVVLLPGLDGTGDLFAELVRETPAGFAATVIPYPPAEPLGYPELAALVERQLPRDEPFLLLGESFSGPVAIRVAAREPAGLRGLILCNTFAVHPAWSGFRYMPWRLAFSFPIPSYKVAFYLVGRREARRWVKPVRDANRRVSARVHAHRMRSVLSEDVRDMLGAVRVPVLYIRGTRDRLVRSGCLRRIRAAKPDIEVAEIDAPHLVLQLQPRASWQAITSFAAARCAL
jgi:pimeloyl-ACP methyl ester carboxylesterase